MNHTVMKFWSPHRQRASLNPWLVRAFSTRPSLLRETRSTARFHVNLPTFLGFLSRYFFAFSDFEPKHCYHFVGLYLSEPRKNVKVSDSKEPYLEEVVSASTLKYPRNLPQKLFFWGRAIKGAWLLVMCSGCWRGLPWLYPRAGPGGCRRAREDHREIFFFGGVWRISDGLLRRYVNPPK